MGTREGQLYLRWVKCIQCELIYLDPRPSQHALSALYDSQGYWQGEAGYKDYLDEEVWRGRQARDRAHWFITKLQKHLKHEAPQVLELGSAAGFFLQELAARGVSAHGLDISKPMVHLADHRTKGNVQITQGSVEESNFPPNNFQGMAAWGCDSNFHDPKSAFLRFQKWLCIGGLLTFNFHDYTHRANFLKGRFKLMPNALYFLSRKHIEDLLQQNNFEILSLHTEYSWMNLASIYHHTGHKWLKPIAKTSWARVPIKLPIPGSYRVLARKTL